MQYWQEHPVETAPKKREFIVALRERAIVYRACEAANVERHTAYCWRAEDPEFRRAWDDAKENTTDRVEESLFNQAVSGKNVVATIFYLKGNRPQYRDRLAVDVNAMNREIAERLAAMDQGLIPSSIVAEVVAKTQQRQLKAADTDR